MSATTRESTTPPAPGKRRRWGTATLVGVVLMAVGVSMLGYVGWEYYGTNIVSKRAQASLSEGLDAQWASAEQKNPVRGDAIALVRIPRFGKTYEVPLVKGVDQKSLARGIGWFPRSAEPGAIGNFAIAGHRVTHGEPFRDFLKLRKGDTVVVETRTDVYTYVLRDAGTDRTVDFTDTWVTDPVPGKPAGTTPVDRMITLVTCSELFHTDDRQVVFGDLRTAEPKPPQT
ncbi:class E sortase [Solicola sp. PLA-1-18]|uniref:class E sortase n=1 Tax=Solicola sp. PLA-1-18 TaxID=3380532 RepID=UPI003B790393